MEYVSACPVCSENSFSDYLSCVDYTVSHETFQLQRCNHCGFVLTNPRPSETALPGYYQSETYISHSDKSTNLIGAAYKIARKFTLDWKYRLIHSHSVVKPSSVLDYGCGTGAFLLQCRQHGLHVAGVEPSPTAFTQANTKTPGAVVQHLQQISGTYDVITLWHVLEHVTSLNETVALLKQHLHQNGTIFIAVPNLLSKDAKEYGAYWAAYDVPRHLWHFSRSTMEKLLQQHRLKISHVAPMRLDAYYVSLLSEKYRKGHSNLSGLARGLAKGWNSNTAARSTGEYSSLIYIVRQ